MSDIVNDLREGRGLTEANGRRDAWVHETMQRAAAEIERLRAWQRRAVQSMRWHAHCEVCAALVAEVGAP